MLGLASIKCCELGLLPPPLHSVHINMPKRIRTPPMAEDAEFYTVSQPYPLNFEWDREEDNINHVRWIAACLGSPAAVWAFYYKPSVRNFSHVSICFKLTVAPGAGKDHSRD